MIRSALSLILLALLVPSPEASAQGNCSTQLLVSGYRSNNVKIYNGCSGEFIRNLDDGNRLRGPQAIRLGPDGLLYVVSELNNRVVRYNGQNLEFVDIFVQDDPATQDDELRGLRSPTAVDFTADGDVIVGGFASNSINRFDGETGEFAGFFISPNGGGLNGLDAGMSFAPDGTLYVPGFDGNHILQFTATGGLLGVLDDSISNPRMILYDTANSRMLVTAWGTGTIEAYSLPGGQAQGIVSGAQFRPSGLAMDLDGTLLVASDTNDDVLRVNPNNGNLIETVVESGAGGLSGATYIYVHEASDDPPPAAEAELTGLYWISGLGQVDGNSIMVSDAVETGGPVFGEGYDPDALSFRRWGSLQIDMLGCRSGELGWDSRGPDSARFGTGGYAVQPIAAGFGVMDCEGIGFPNIENLAWVSGGWFGGASRNGEGLMIDVIDDENAFVTWFTYGQPVETAQ